VHTNVPNLDLFGQITPTRFKHLDRMVARRVEFPDLTVARDRLQTVVRQDNAAFNKDESWLKLFWHTGSEGSDTLADLPAGQF